MTNETHFNLCVQVFGGLTGPVLGWLGLRKGAPGTEVALGETEQLVCQKNTVICWWRLCLRVCLSQYCRPCLFSILLCEHVSHTICFIAYLCFVDATASCTAA